MKTRFAVAALIAELQYLAWSAVRAARDAVKRRIPPHSVDPTKLIVDTIVARREYLRAALARIPSWPLGHTRLGMCEVELQTYSSAPPPARSIATIRLSANAIRALEASAGLSSEGRAGREADLLEGMLRLYDRDFDSALVIFERLVTPEACVQLPRKAHYLALEHAGNLAILSNREEDARRYLSRVPAAARTSVTHTALELISRSKLPPVDGDRPPTIH